MSMFHVGQRVALKYNARPCIVEKFAQAGVRYPIVGLVYTIRDIVFATGSGNALLLLSEIINPCLPGEGLERGFDAEHFRPVKDTSIEIFRSLLSPVPEEVA